VILAAENQSGRMVAAKVMEKARLRPDQLERAANEARIMGSMCHPYVCNLFLFFFFFLVPAAYRGSCIVRLLNTVDTPTHYAIVMEYARGGDLLAMVSQKGRLSETRARQIFAQILSAVNHAHEKGFIHRDLKLGKHENLVLIVDRARRGANQR
jgi:serine/threonine protein kinase